MGNRGLFRGAEKAGADRASGILVSRRSGYAAHVSGLLRGQDGILPDPAQLPGLDAAKCERKI